MARVLPAVPTSPSVQLRRPLRRLALAGLLALGTAVIQRHCAPQGFFMASPAVLDRPATKHRTDVDADRDSRQKKAKAGNSTIANATLLLSSGYPNDISPGTAQGPQWATCFVDDVEPGYVNANGVSSARKLLEEWVMRGDKEVVGDFRMWRQRASADASVRCVTTSPEETEGVTCLECVARSGAQHGSSPFAIRGRTAVLESSIVMTFSGLSECLMGASSIQGGTGFCKSGTVAMTI